MGVFTGTECGSPDIPRLTTPSGTRRTRSYGSLPPLPSWSLTTEVSHIFGFNFHSVLYKMLGFFCFVFIYRIFTHYLLGKFVKKSSKIPTKQQKYSM